MSILYYGADGCIHQLGDNELTHYNHNHDALGRFAKSSGARSAQRQLRSLEVKRVKALGKEMKADYKYSKARAKYEDSGSKSKLKRKKLYDKAAKRESEYLKSIKARQNVEKTKNESLKKAYNKGYQVSGYYTMRSSQRGKDFVNFVLGSQTIGYGVVLGKNTSQAQKYAAKYNNQTPSRIGMTKYSVYDRNKRKKTSTRRKAISYMLYD